ncbi:MAG: GNAT family N-acetyltransferase [Patescibacteria group bacterium]
MENAIIREAKKEDSHRVWEIRNHPDVRTRSNSRDDISFEQHQGWFLNKYFKQTGNFIYIAEVGGVAVGYCRIDFDSSGRDYVISIAVDPGYQGFGLGKLLLEESLRRFPVELVIRAEIQRDNLPSLRLFEKYGFKITEQDGKNFYLSRKIET